MTPKENHALTYRAKRFLLTRGGLTEFEDFEAADLIWDAISYKTPPSTSEHLISMFP
jgi:hypothetical protein